MAWMSVLARAGPPSVSDHVGRETLTVEPRVNSPVNETWPVGYSRGMVMGPPPPPGSGTTPGLLAGQLLVATELLPFLMSNENVYVSPAFGAGAAAPSIFNLRLVGSGFAMVKVAPTGDPFKV